MFNRSHCRAVLGLFMAAGVLLAHAAVHTASLSFPGSALVFKGKGLDPPDLEGHFAVGIKLPFSKIKAEHCDAPFLVVGLGDLNKPAEALTAGDKAIIAHNNEVYAGLMASAKTGQTVSLSFRNNPEYLSVRGGILYASYCILSIDGPKGTSRDD